MPALASTELDQARQYFLESRSQVVDVAKGLSEAQWRFKPSPDRWSIAENLEHMVIVHERVLARLEGQLAQAPPPPSGRDPQRIDAIILEKIPDRSIKAKAPDFIQPAGQITFPDLMDRLFRSYEELSDFIESTPGLRAHLLDAPPLRLVTNGEYDTMDGFQWALTAAAHDRRHCAQILELKADPHYPL